MLIFSILLCSILAGHVTDAQWEAYEAAIPFIDYVTKSTLPTQGQALVFYGADWCKHCQLFTPIWLEFQKKVKENKWNSRLQIAKVECTEEENKEMCSKLDGYPTVKRFSDGAEKGELKARTFEELMKGAEGIMEGLSGEVGRLGQVLEEEKSLRTHNREGKVIELTDAIFDTVLTEF
jgi:thiol-disulfide isomerase/thioredoxin